MKEIIVEFSLASFWLRPSPNGDALGGCRENTSKRACCARTRPCHVHCTNNEERKIAFWLKSLCAVCVRQPARSACCPRATAEEKERVPVFTCAPQRTATVLLPVPDNERIGTDNESYEPRAKEQKCERGNPSPLVRAVVVTSFTLLTARETGFQP